MNVIRTTNSHLKDLVLRVLGLFLDVRHDGPDGLDDCDDERSEGCGAGVVEEGSLDRGTHCSASDRAFVAAEIPRRHGHRDDNL